jgi:heterodisulfide reductase subunit C
MQEIHRIFEVSGGKDFYDLIEQHSERKAREMGYDGAGEEYLMDVYTLNSENHY